MKEKFLNFYSKNKKIVWIVGVILVVIVGIALLSGHGEKEKWHDLLLESHLPEVKKGSLDVGSNLDDYLSFRIKNVKKSYYNDYKKSCIDMGYNIESAESGNRYEAFNKDGYELSIAYYSDNEISIILKAPEEMSEITWPTSGIGAKLPKPASTYGKVTSDSSDTYRVLLGKTALDEFNNYVKTCQDNGFNVDYNKQEKSYSAKNNEGYRLNVSYEGNNTIDILIQIPEENNSSINTELTQPTDKPDNNDSNSSNDNSNSSSNNSSEMIDGMRKEFKDAMDSYEVFMNEYVAFMKKYNANPTDTSLLTDYANYLDKYTKFVSDFDKWDSDNLNKKEAAYYLDVQNRVSKKLLEVVG